MDLGFFGGWFRRENLVNGMYIIPGMIFQVFPLFLFLCFGKERPMLEKNVRRFFEVSFIFGMHACIQPFRRTKIPVVLFVYRRPNTLRPRQLQCNLTYVCVCDDDMIPQSDTYEIVTMSFLPFLLSIQWIFSTNLLPPPPPPKRALCGASGAARTSTPTWAGSATGGSGGVTCAAWSTTPRRRTTAT